MAEQARRREERLKQYNKDGSRKKKQGLDVGKWVQETVQQLLRHNHTLQEMAEYPLDRVMVLLEASQRSEVKQRVEFIADMAQVVGGVFGGGEELSEHIDLLQHIVNGE